MNEQKEELARVVVTNPFVGIWHMQVCATKDATDEEILAVCNLANPSGTSNGWAIVRKADDDFWGKVGPVQCEDHPDRMHYLVAC